MSAAAWPVERLETGAGAIARAVLDDLPEWFGEPAALEAYVQATDCLPTFVAAAPEGAPAGFAAVERHTEVAAELRVIGVRRRWHGQGCGRALLARAEADLMRQGVRWLTVKTLAASHPDPSYAETRAFYAARGFEPLEVFATLWGVEHPCLLMAKRLG